MFKVLTPTLTAYAQVRNKTQNQSYFATYSNWFENQILWKTPYKKDVQIVCYLSLFTFVPLFAATSLPGIRDTIGDFYSWSKLYIPVVWKE